MRTFAVCLVLMPLAAAAAPAPAVKAVRPPEIKPGTYLHVWRGMRPPQLVHMRPDGFWACHWHGQWYHGQWKCKGGVLEVTEWLMDDPDNSKFSWKIEMSSPLKGKDFYGEFELIPHAEKGGGE